MAPVSQTKATAASAAVPPEFKISNATALALGSSDATPPTYPGTNPVEAKVISGSGAAHDPAIRATAPISAD